MKPAGEVLENAKKYRQRKRELLEDFAEWFHDREGEMFNREEAVRRLSEEFGVEESLASDVVAGLVSDLVDPVVQRNLGDTRKVGVRSYREGDDWYGYIQVDDIHGERKRLVCGHCVKEAEKDSEVVYGEEGKGSIPADADWHEMERRMEEHVRKSHRGSKLPGVETGAQLLSGTTIAGNTAWHMGNDQDNLDADKLDGLHNSDFVKNQQAMTASGYIVEKEEVSSQVAVSFAAKGSPVGVGLGSGGCIWQVDKSGDSIFKLDQSGNLLNSFGAPGSTPEGITVDSGGCLWHADDADASIYKLRASDGSIVSSFDSPGGSPQGLGTDADDFIWNSDLNDTSIYKIDPASPSTPESQFDSPGGEPLGLTIDSNGCIWNADNNDNSIYKLDRAGSIVAPSSFASPSTSPKGLGIDPSGFLWHSDSLKTELLRFKKKAGVYKP